MIQARNPNERPTFVGSLLKSLSQSYERRGFRGLIPWRTAVFAVGAAIAAYFVPAAFFTRVEACIPIYAGVLTLNGLLLALAWSAFAKIFENICSGEFAVYLHKNELTETYMFHISYIHVAQIVAVAASGLGLMLLAFGDIPLIVSKAMFFVLVFTSVYAINQAAGSVTILHDLIWYKSIFDGSSRNGNITNLPNRPPR
jgi:hypothetical protein